MSCTLILSPAPASAGVFCCADNERMSEPNEPPHDGVYPITDRMRLIVMHGVTEVEIRDERSEGDFAKLGRLTADEVATLVKILRRANGVG